MTPKEIDGLESQVRYYCRQFPAVFARAKGSTVWDENGRPFIDLFSGCGALNYGHNPEPLKRALIEYLLNDGIVHSLDLRTSAKVAFMSAFQEIILLPRGLNYRMMFTGPTGASAIEAALKLARNYTGRPNIAAFTGAFHGMSLGALAATGSSFHRHAAGVALLGIDRMPYDGFFGPDLDSTRMISQMLTDQGSGLDPPAAFLLETIQCEGGVVSASNEWLRKIASIARQFGSLLIVDDIQAGCGRTGEFFSFESYGIVPDVICLSKSLSGYGLPLSLVLIRPDFDIWKPGEHNGTFRGQNCAFVTGRAALNYWQDAVFHSNLTNNIRIMDRWSTELSERLSRLGSSIRGRGLIRGINCRSDREAANIVAGAYDGGMLIETCGSYGQIVKLSPPLTMEAAALAGALEELGELVVKRLSPPRIS
jgi:diaminobutyrate-2-oxoglutarate transaminase